MVLGIVLAHVEDNHPQRHRLRSWQRRRTQVQGAWRDVVSAEGADLSKVDSALFIALNDSAVADARVTPSRVVGRAEAVTAYHTGREGRGLFAVPASTTDRRLDESRWREVGDFLWP